MRNTIIGIVVGVVVGVMIGASVIAPRLQQAQSRTAPHGEETLERLNTETTPAPAPKAFSTASTIASGQPAIRLRVASAFARELPALGALATRLESELVRLSGGAFEMKVFGPGVMVPEKDTFEAVASGTLEAAFAAPGQWGREIPALQLFSSVPFGPSAEEYIAWYYFGGGAAMFQDLFSDRGVHAIICGAIPAEASGWFKRPVRTTGDFRKLKIRAFGLGGKVLSALGADVVELGAGEILGALEDGRLDGAEFSMPSVDAELGFHRVAKHYYFPGWHQPASLFALMVNAKVWEGLPKNARAQVETVCGDNVRYGMAAGGGGQFAALKALGLQGVEVHRWSDLVLSAMRRAWFDVVQAEAGKDANFARVWASLEAFRRDYAIWQELNGL